MTDGSSQGLFVIIAVVIFGIFVLISYVLFKDTLQPALANIFTDGLEQAEENLTGIVKENPINIQASREDKNYLYAKIRDANEAKNETEIWVQAKKLDNGTLELYKSSISDGNYKDGSSDMIGSLAIPDTINGMKIVKIGGRAFRDSTFDGELKLPSSLTSIGSAAFYASKFDGKLNLPDSLEFIGYDAFVRSEFKGKLILPDSLTSIDYQAFYNSKFDGELKLPDGLTSIGSSAFRKSEFKGELKLPDGLINIQGFVFENSTFGGELKLPDSLTGIGWGSFYNSNFTGTLDVSHVTYIQEDAFKTSKIDKVIRGDVEMSDRSNNTNTSGIHPRSIKLANGSWYNGTNA